MAVDKATRRERLRGALVVGAGPAGLMAAEALSAAGVAVTIAEAKPSPARKFLMAGKSGLNLTKDESRQEFAARFDPAAPLAPILAAFGPAEVQAWARGLGQSLFTGTTGRVFPVAMKASPLLRAWLARLQGAGVALRSRWRWAGWSGNGLAFDTTEGPVVVDADAVVLALGGASWARLGSDGAWAPLLAARGVPVSPFRPSNAGLGVDWSAPMAVHFGKPVKNVGLLVGGRLHRGEFVVSSRGLEGGAIYPLTPAFRDGAALALDLVPDLSEAEAARRLARAPSHLSRSNRLRRGLGLDPVRLALFNEVARNATAGDIPRLVKALPVPHAGPRPLDEAISIAGGVGWDGLDDGLMLRALPGVFVAGEMIDWEAPTGGYLLTACLATGRHAGLSAARWLASGKGLSRDPAPVPTA